ncbi:MAG: HPr(Ser) kinase/phosphatase [Anaerorhabdus sp.]
MEINGKVLVREVAEYFNFEQVTGNDDSLNRWIVVPDLNRPGLELVGFFKEDEMRRVLIMGDKELTFIEGLDENIQRERFEKLVDEYTPMLVLSRNRNCPPVLIDVANRYNFPIFKSTLKSFRLMVDLVTYLDERLAPTDNIHGGFLSVYGKGIIITGESGMGKSEVALELIRRGHTLIADDRVDISRVHNGLVGYSPDLLYGMLEIRGIGIIDVIKMFGASALLQRGNVDLVIRLERFDSTKAYRRVGNEDEVYTNILGIDVPTLVLPVREGRTMAILIESAVTNFQLKLAGFNSSVEFEKRVYQHIQNKNKEARGED